MNTEHLRNEIEAVFPFIEKPKGLALSFHKDDCFQCGYLRDELEQYQGEEIPPEAIREIHQEMSCLSAHGWCWALPSYLRFCITEEAKYNQMETEFLIYNLAPELKHELETKQRLSSLNQQQILCLIHFLEWCQQDEHWGQYCPEEISSGIAYLSTVRA
ncbi:hypothetical protein Ssed_0719 [Shewanella sediminis HAW-EB3]|uniref:Uncharacterized protein n=1 Tax=Shewanella sediminis (strain HAW-EB3) TaxID=425104 RepID=A8FR57_SHESH|nr:DUF6714 family protein [Shewanella sediminis]ABV35330.1 hypothetical protein Ssed_0719 [Shewanella sediminis HAW-EB3]